jgi:hypothetical protein
MSHLNDKKRETTIWINNTRDFRRVVGINGMLLPVLIWVFLYLTSGHYNVLESISHYYYTRSNSIFIGVMATLSMFLIVYNYKDEKADFILSTIAGIAAIFVILFPTDNLLATSCALENSHVITYLACDETRVIIHYVSAAIFFVALAIMSAFIFTKSDSNKKKSPQNIIRNRIYRSCAVLMILSILAILLLGKFNLIADLKYNEWNLTFWFEVVAIESFGFSWLVKGEAIFSD